MRHKQNGNIVALLLAGVAAVAFLSVMGYQVFSLSSASGQNNLRTQSGSLLSQAAFTLSTEATDPDADGIPETAAYTAGAGPTGGGVIPITSGAPKTDAWGTSIGFCPWDNGSINSSANRITGDNPALQSSVVFAVISAGPDKVFQTTCAQAKAGTVQGDDGMRVMNVSQIRQGVGGTVYYGDPVNDMTALNLLVPASGYTPKTGEQRLVKSNNQTWTWNGASWGATTPMMSLTATAGANCDAYGVGAMAQDGSGNPMVCQP